jgi:S-formylglutathione hydrolase
MGGHGALTLALRHPWALRQRVGVLRPSCAPPMPWGEKAFTAYLGDDRSAWQAHDAVA